jgi:glucose-1-phosphate thymidylyltransferase
MKGIILAGGTGSRLYPITLAVNKQLLPVYNKPMIYYPLTTLMLAGIKDILMIVNPGDESKYRDLLKDGSQWGIKIQYAVQDKPRGLADAFIVGESFIQKEPVALVLGDNLFYSEGLIQLLEKAASLKSGARIFGYTVRNPEEYGVVELDKNGKVTGLVEKPAQPKSNLAVPGLYFYDGKVSELAKSLKPSPRGEIEITDLNRLYLDKGELQVEVMGRGVAWLDTGSYDSLLQASQFIQTIETRQSLMIGCPEEIAYRKKWINHQQLSVLAQALEKTEYGRYLWRVAGD